MKSSIAALALTTALTFPGLAMAWQTFARSVRLTEAGRHFVECVAAAPISSIVP